jgi:hypothetical protein
LPISSDTTRTSQSELAKANSLLVPLKSFAQSRTSPEVDIWKLLNSFFVEYYWFVLGDLGQVSPVTYNNSDGFLVPLNFSRPAILHPSTNNLFLNTTLAGTVFSDIGLNETGTDVVHAITIPNWGAAKKPLPKFRWMYLCNQRWLKPGLDLVVSVFGLALSLLHTIYGVGMKLLGGILWCSTRISIPRVQCHWCSSRRHRRPNAGGQAGRGNAAPLVHMNGRAVGEQLRPETSEGAEGWV